MFQSSPAPKGGCNAIFAAMQHHLQEFQSSPAPKGGCNETYRGKRDAERKFQSSPAPKGGCNPTSLELPPDVCPECVSILTRPEGRVQPTICSYFSLSRLMYVSLDRAMYATYPPQFANTPTPATGTRFANHR